MEETNIENLHIDWKMSTEDRLAFWKTLCGLHGENMDEDSQRLMSVIKYPRFLYRYRSVTNNTLAALMDNKLFFSTPNYYDDPFDTYLRIDKNKVIMHVQQDLMSRERITDYASFHKISFETAKNSISNILYNFLNLYKENSFIYLREVLRNESYSVCFADTWKNEALWLKYADQHRGFAIVYDLQDQSACLCGGQENCFSCQMLNTSIKYYPVCYTDEKYDATEYAKYLAVFQAFKFKNDNYIYNLQNTLPSFYWEREKISLIKKRCHEYDAEWRGILNYKYQFDSKGTVFKKIKPYAVILGLKIQDNERTLVINAAKNVGIDTIGKIVILNDELNLQQIII